MDRGVLRSDCAALGLAVNADQLLCTELTHNAENLITGGIWRVEGHGIDAVVKVLRNSPGGTSHWQPSTDPKRWNYWRREPDLYETGGIGSFASAGLRSPELLGVVDRSPAEVAVWLRYVSGRSGYSFTAEGIVATGFALGQAQGAWSVAGVGLPAYASHRFLREYIESKPYGWDAFASDEAWAHPVVRQGFPTTLRADMTRLHEEREWFLRVMERLPRTLCHLDLWPNNIIAADDSLYLVDYAFVGDGTFGEDIGNLVVDAVFDRFVSAVSPCTSSDSGPNMLGT